MNELVDGQRSVYSFSSIFSISNSFEFSVAMRVTSSSALTGSFQTASSTAEVCGQDYKIWEREYLNRENCVCYDDLTDHSQYMFYCNYFQLNELIDVEPANGSVYIRSVTEPFSFLL
jgi:hypothetical protein